MKTISPPFLKLIALATALVLVYYLEAQSCTPSITITASADTICPLASVTFIANAVNAGDTPVYQWQLNGFNAGSNSDTFIVSGLSTGSTINCILIPSASCDSGLRDTSNVITMHVIPFPGAVLTANPNPVCSGDEVQLNATLNPFCGLGIASTGNNQSPVLGSGTITQPGGGTTFPTVFGNFDHSYRQQMLYMGNELSSVLGGAQAINSISFYIPHNGFNSNAYLQNLYVRIGCTTADSLISWQDNLSLVLATQNYQPVEYWNELQLIAPFYWDGVSNIVVEVCDYCPVTFGNENNKAQCTSTAFSSYLYQESETSDLCGTQSTPMVSNLRPNIRFNYGTPLFSGYTYHWQPSTGAGAVSNAAILNPTARPVNPTTYYFYISDTSGCTLSDSVLVNTDTVSVIPTVSLDTSIAICLGATCTASAVVTNGSNTATYQWQVNGIDTLTDTGFLSFPNHGGVISCTINTHSNCANPDTATAFLSIPVDTPPALPVITLNVDTFTSSAATDNQWYLNGQVIPGGTGQIFVASQGGNYVDVVTGAGGCTDTSGTVLVGVIIKGRNISCFGGSNAVDTAVATGGTQYNYSWSTADTNQIVQSLGPGIYSVTVTANTGISSSASVNIVSDNFNFIVNVSQPFCGDPDSGSAQVQITFGAGVYNYSWSNEVSGNPDSDLAPGLYTVTVTDTNLCSEPQSFTVSQYPAFGADAGSTSSAGNNGTATAQGTGGTPPYTYFWNTGATGSTITSLAPGVYTVTVIDANGCSVSLSITVELANGINVPSVPGQAVQIFPNPTGGNLSILLTGNGFIALKLMDVTGREIYNRPLEGAESPVNLQLNLDNASEGLYVLQVITQAGILNNQVVIQR